MAAQGFEDNNPRNAGERWASTNIRDNLTLVSLTEREYFQVIEQAAAADLTSGAIYDALLGYCAGKAGAETLYTWNTRDYLRLPPDIARRVRQPG